MPELDEKMRKTLRDIEFIESTSSNIDTQNALFESLESSKQEGRFKNADEMFTHMKKEWDEDQD